MQYDQITISSRWPSFAIRGLFALIIGLAALFLPEITFRLLIVLLGVFFIADGVLALVTSFGNGERPWWSSVIWGVIGIAAGIITFAAPNITAFTLMLILAAWAIITGVMEVATAIALRKEIKGEWLLGLTGSLSVLFGIFVMFAPAFGAITITLLIGVYAITFGILLLAVAYNMRKYGYESHIKIDRYSP